MGEKITNAVASVFFRGLLGGTTIYFVNILLEQNQIAAQVGINMITLASSALLGVPGIGLLYGITFFEML